MYRRGGTEEKAVSMADQHFDDDEAPEEVTLNEVIQPPKIYG